MQTGNAVFVRRGMLRVEILAFHAAPRSHGANPLISFQAIGDVLSARNPTSLREKSAINAVEIRYVYIVSVSSTLSNCKLR